MLKQKQDVGINSKSEYLECSFNLHVCFASSNEFLPPEIFLFRSCSSSRFGVFVPCLLESVRFLMDGFLMRLLIVVAKGRYRLLVLVFHLGNVTAVRYLALGRRTV